MRFAGWSKEALVYKVCSKASTSPLSSARTLDSSSFFFLIPHIQPTSIITIMATSIDDLVASLSSNHIGQEAMDLAALQTQLAQALHYQPSSLPQRSNTPIQRTPRASYNEGQWVDLEQTWGWNQAGRTAAEEVDGIDDDEQMVEDLLFPSSSSSSSNPASSRFTASQAVQHRRPSVSSSYAHTQFEPAPSNSSLFTTTDPFYLAQLQTAQSPTSPSSFFSQYGNPSQQSPFMMGHHSQNRPYALAHFAGPSEPEPHVFFATPQTAFT